MTDQIVLGLSGVDGDVDGCDLPLKMDIPRLIETRLLLQANSGGGKSWALRRILEQSFGMVQHLVIDPEGEFATLRERYDYVLAGRAGDTPAEPRSAGLLARRLLELGTSAIIDIYELKHHERIAFVKNFLEALVNAPKALWHPALVVIDEAHVYAPEKDRAESLSAVVDLATRGRKRGFCPILATQRIAKLSKDAAAELNNKLIGRASLDNDMRRAAEELGMAAREDREGLRTLAEGEFYGFGPAISQVVTKLKVGPVITTHPKAGSRHLMTPPPATAKVKAVLAQLADLPGEAEQEINDLKGAKAEISRLRGELTRARRSPSDDALIERRIKEAVTQQVEVQRVASVRALRELQEDKSGLERQIERWERWREGVAAVLKRSIESLELAVAGVPLKQSPPLRAKPQPIPAGPVHPAEPASARPERPLPPDPSPNGAVTDPQKKLLDALAAFEPLGVDQVDRGVLAAYARVSPLSSGYTNNLGRLRTLGYIHYPAGGQVALTEQGRSLASPDQLISSVEDLHEGWYAILPRPQAAILRALIEIYPRDLHRQELAERLEVSAASSGYTNNLGRLKTLGCIDYPAGGRVRASERLWPEGVA